MDTNALRAKAMKSEADARERLSQQSNELLATTWLLTETMPMSQELAVTRGWIIDELGKRMSAVQFNRWLWTDGDAVDPLPFLR